jgi:hypothetical protein
MIRLDEYFSGHAGHSEISESIKQNAIELLESINQLMLEAQEDGVGFTINPKTRSYISGSGNGGFRPSDSKVGASKSKHKEGKAVDIFDPDREFASWCLAHKSKLADAGLYMENPQWTINRSGIGGWVHLQNAAPGSGMIVFRPSISEPLGPPPPQWA